MFNSNKKLKALLAAKANERLKEKFESQEKTLNAAMAWVKDMKMEHLPTVSQIDLSLSEGEGMLEKLSNKILSDTFCISCRSRWPCRTLENVKELSSVLYGAEYQGLPRTLTEKDRVGAIDVRL